VTRAALLDVNVLVALFDPDHIHHEPAHDWFADHKAHGWATCPFTESAFLRVLSNPAYAPRPHRVSDLAKLLRRFCASGHHAFWSDSISCRDDSVFSWSMIGGHRQVADVYLLGLAVKMNGALATFDRTIPLTAVPGATKEALDVIAG
jgi:toxin-antitoxin system PIN domain toxin